MVTSRMCERGIPVCVEQYDIHFDHTRTLNETEAVGMVGFIGQR